MSADETGVLNVVSEAWIFPNLLRFEESCEYATIGWIIKSAANDAAIDTIIASLQPISQPVRYRIPMMQKIVQTIE